jgi:hypothetical protein
MGNNSGKYMSSSYEKEDHTYTDMRRQTSMELKDNRIIMADRKPALRDGEKMNFLTHEEGKGQVR